MTMILHNYFRSSASVRLRIALNLKGLPYDYASYHLRRGEHLTERYLSLNPQGLVPCLELDDGSVLTQSLAVIEYLDETHPEPPLLPIEPKQKAFVRSIACAISCDIHPINNLRVLGYLRSEFGADDDRVAAWFRHWVSETFAPLERLLSCAPGVGRFCFGDEPSLADICLYAQVLNNARFGFELESFPLIAKIFEACSMRSEFERAAPQNQPDAE